MDNQTNIEYLSLEEIHVICHDMLKFVDHICKSE